MKKYRNVEIYLFNDVLLIYNLYLFILVFVYLFIHLFKHLFKHLFIYSHIYSCIYLFIYLYFSHFESSIVCVCLSCLNGSLKFYKVECESVFVFLSTSLMPMGPDDRMRTNCNPSERVCVLPTKDAVGIFD